MAEEAVSAGLPECCDELGCVGLHFGRHNLSRLFHDVARVRF